MSDLATLERAFAAALVVRSPAAADVAPFAGPAARAQERLRLYRGNVQANTRKALANAYPVCAQLVGEDFFDGLALEYAARSPSRSGDLNEYGDAFAGFLAGFAPVIGQVPYLPDVARLEWHVHVAHYAADAPPFDAAALAGLGDGTLAQMRFVLAPAAAVVPSRWPVASLWRAHRSGDGDRDVAAIDVASGGECALVSRPGFRVDVAAIGEGEHVLFAAVASGATFAGALLRARAADPAFVPDAALQRWVVGGVIAGVVA